MPLTVAQLVARLTADTSGFYRSMAVANSAMIRSGGIVKRVTAGMAIGLGGAALASARVAANFEESMNVLKAVLDPSAKQFGALRDQAVALGKDMKLPGVSAKDVAESMTSLAKAGLSVEDITKSIRGTLELATAGQIEFSDAATITARALKAFGLDGSRATDVANLFAAAAAGSTAEMSDIALAFQQASSNFDMANQSIETLTTSIAIMADKGVVGSDAGTSLKTMMQRLFAPTEKASKIMKNLGIDIIGAGGKIKDMRSIIMEFEDAFAGMTDAKKAKLLGQIFGSDAIRSANRVLLGGVKNWDKYSKTVNKSGVAHKLAEARMKGLNGAIRGFFNVVETLAVQIGSAMLPVLTKAVRAVSNWVEKFDASKIIAFFTAIKNGVVAVYNFIAGSENAQTAIMGLVGSFVAFRGIMFVEGIIKKITVAWRILNTSFVASPIGILLTAIAGLAAALYLLYTRSETVRNAINQAWQSMKSTLIPIFNAIKTEAIEAFNAIWSYIKPVVQNIREFVTTHWETIKAVTSRIWNAVKAIIGGVLRGLAGTARAALNAVKGVIQFVTGLIRGDWEQVWNGIKTFFGSILNLIKDTARNIWNTINDLTGGAFSRIANTIKDWAVRAYNWFKGKFNDMVQFFVTLPGRLGNLAVSIGKAIVQGIVNGLGGIAEAVGNAILNGVNGAINWVKGKLGIGSPSKVTADQLGKPLAQGVLKGWLIGIAPLPETMKESLTKAIEKGREAIDAARSKLTSAFSGLAEDVMSAFDAATAAAVTPGEKALADFLSAKDAADAAKEMQTAVDRVTAAEAALAGFVPTEGMSAAEIAAEQARLVQEVADAKQAVADLVATRAFEAEKARLEAIAAEERKQYEASRNLQKEHLEAKLEALLAQLSKEGASAREANKAIQALFKEFGIDYKNSGLNLGLAFAQGLRESASDVRKAARFIARVVAQYLKLDSPADKGPMSDLNHWWDPMGKMLAESAGVGDFMKGFPRGGVPIGVGRGARGGIVQNIVIEGSVVTERQLAMRTRELLLRERNRIPAIGLS